jgi:exportin-T
MWTVLIQSILTVLRNKFSHTVTLFFLCTYNEQWPTFFSDIFTLIRPTEQHSRAGFNRHVSLLFFHIVLEISGEVADQIIKSARTFLATRHARDGRVRDGVRERDAAKINEAVLTIVAEGAERMNELRKNSSLDQQTRDDLDHAIEVVDWGVRTFGSYVGMSSLVFSSSVVNLVGNYRLDRYQPDCHSYNRPSSIHPSCRSITPNPIGNFCGAPSNSLQRTQRAR